MCRRDSGVSSLRLLGLPAVRPWWAEQPRAPEAPPAPGLLPAQLLAELVRSLSRPPASPAAQAAPPPPATLTPALPPLDKPAYTVDEVAALLGTTRKAVFARAARGQLPGVFRLGRSLRFRGPELIAFLVEGRAPSPARSRR